MDREQAKVLEDRIMKLPRVGLSHRPTPLEEMPRLRDHLEGPLLLVKRDDLTGLAFGGNKARMFEFVLGEARSQGADVILAGCAVQSNYCRQLAAACAKVGIRCQLLLRRVRGKRDQELQGNYLLDRLLGAEVEVLEDCRDWVEQSRALQVRAEELEETGNKVYLARVGDEKNLGLHAVAYVEAALELICQCEEKSVFLDELWCCSSDTTQAGLALAFKHLGYPVKLVGVSPVEVPVGYLSGSLPQVMADISNQAASLLDLETRLSKEDFTSLSEYVGPGYGKVYPRCLETMKMVARYEGLILDPVYTSKAFTALVEHIRQKRIPQEQTVVFLHTGGMPALFAYAKELDLDY